MYYIYICVYCDMVTMVNKLHAFIYWTIVVLRVGSIFFSETFVIAVNDGFFLVDCFILNDFMMFEWHQNITYVIPFKLQCKYGFFFEE